MTPDVRTVLAEIGQRVNDRQDDGLSVRLAFDDRRELLAALRAVLDLLDGPAVVYIPDIERAIASAMDGDVVAGAASVKLGEQAVLGDRLGHSTGRQGSTMRKISTKTTTEASFKDADDAVDFVRSALRGAQANETVSVRLLAGSKQWPDPATVYRAQVTVEQREY